MSDLRTGELDGEGWGKWDGVPLPQWLRSWMAPYSTDTRERRLQELLDALSAPAAGPKSGQSLALEDPNPSHPMDSPRREK